MTEQQIFAIAIVVFIVFGAVLLFYYIRLKHKEKMELIRKGDYAFEGNYLENLKYNILAKSIILISLAAGFGIAYGISRGNESSSVVLVYIISLLSTTGIGLMFFYFIIKKALK